MWLGTVATILGTVIETINDGAQLLGVDGIKQTMADAGFDPATTAKILLLLGPLIVIARLRSLRKQ
jgi:hypothetical protein